MRFVLLSICIAFLTVTVSCTNDEETASWVLEAVNGRNPVSAQPNNNKVDQDSGAGANGDQSSTTPPKLDLTPTKTVGLVDCMTKDNEMGLCVLYYQCNSQTKTIIEDGEGLIDLRINNCPHYLEVCCKTSDRKITKEDNRQPGDDDSSMATSPNRNANGPVWPFTKKPDLGGADDRMTNVPQCGRNNSANISPFVFSNKNVEQSNAFALYGDFPWMVALLKRSGYSSWSQSDYLGGGTLIHPSVVMTVAHKILTKKKNYAPTELKCRAGEHDTQADSEQYKHQERNVLKYIIHEGYYRTSLLNDVALLFLETPFQLENAPHIGTGCLATSAPPPGRVCYSMGWGRIDPKNHKTYAHVLKKVLLHPVERNTCQELLRAARLTEHFVLHESFTCASGDQNVDSCRGDGGSPLVCTISGDPAETRYAVHGMVVYGIKCFDPAVPGVYADTAHLKPWIDTTMQQQGYDASYYTV